MLSHLIDSLLSLFSKQSFIASSNQQVKIAFFAICESANSSAFMLEVVTVSCLLTCHAIELLNRVIIYSCELFQSIMLFAKDALLVIMKNLTPAMLISNLIALS